MYSGSKETVFQLLVCGEETISINPLIPINETITIVLVSNETYLISFYNYSNWFTLNSKVS